MLPTTTIRLAIWIPSSLPASSAVDPGPLGSCGPVPPKMPEGQPAPPTRPGKTGTSVVSAFAHPKVHWQILSTQTLPISRRSWSRLGRESHTRSAGPMMWACDATKFRHCARAPDHSPQNSPAMPRSTTFPVVRHTHGLASGEQPADQEVIHRHCAHSRTEGKEKGHAVGTE